MHRFFHPELSKKILLDRDEGHHLARVMRIGVGGSVEIVDGKGGLAHAEVTEIKRDHVELSLKKVEPKISPDPAFTLVQAYLRMPKLEWLVEKATELGVTRFLFFPGELSEKESLSETQLEHLHRIAIAAMKQCGRRYLPSFELCAHLSDARLDEKLFYAEPDPELPWLHSKNFEAPLALCIGPERGFHEDELAFLKKKGEGVRLHRNILRAETAALCAASLISQHI